MLKESGLSDYLVLLSICQTCRYKGVSFLKFLVSGLRDIDSFCEGSDHGVVGPPSRFTRRFCPAVPQEQEWTER